MDYCKTCVYYPPSSCDGKPCTQCDANNPFLNCYVNKEDYITKERMNERLAMMHKFYPDAKPTNADRIRSMTDEELADWLATITNPNTAAAYNGYCLSGSTSMFFEWLQAESGES